jgi:microcystin degradation protein MlrC
MSADHNMHCSANQPKKRQNLTMSIVEQCAQIAASTPCPYTDAGEEANHAWDMACHEAAKRIRDHFKQ